MSSFLDTYGWRFDFHYLNGLPFLGDWEEAIYNPHIFNIFMYEGITDSELETIGTQFYLFVLDPVNYGLGLKIMKALINQKYKKRISDYLKLSGELANQVNNTIGSLTVYGPYRMPVTVESPEIYGAFLSSLLADPSIKFLELPIVVEATPPIKWGTQALQSRRYSDNVLHCY